MFFLLSSLYHHKIIQFPHLNLSPTRRRCSVKVTDAAMLNMVWSQAYTKRQFKCNKSLAGSSSVVLPSDPYIITVSS